VYPGLNDFAFIFFLPFCMPFSNRLQELVHREAGAWPDDQNGLTPILGKKKTLTENIFAAG
jgi:hypothetical protein